MIYKTNTWSHVRQLRTSLFFLFMMIAVTVLIVISLGEKSGWDDIAVGGGIFLLFNAEALIIHSRYWLLNRSMEIEEIGRKAIRVSLGKRSVIIQKEDIQLIQYNLTRPYYENSLAWSSADDYNYLLLQTKSGDKFYITSLISPNLELPIDFVKMSSKVMRIRCWPK